MGILGSSRKNIPAVINQFTLTESPKLTERAKSTQRALVSHRFEKLDIVTYKEKRTEYRKKHVSKIKDEFESSKNLMSELQSIEIRRNTLSFVHSPDKTMVRQAPNVKSKDKNYKSFCEPSEEPTKFSTYTIRRHEKSLGRTPEKENKRLIEESKSSDLDKYQFSRQSSKNKGIHGNEPFDMAIKEEVEEDKDLERGSKKAHKSKNYHTEAQKRKNNMLYPLAVIKNPSLTQYLAQNYESVLKKAKRLEQQRKALENTFYKTMNDKKVSNMKSSKPESYTKVPSRNQKYINKPGTSSRANFRTAPKELTSSTGKDVVRSRNPSEVGILQNYLNSSKETKLHSNYSSNKLQYGLKKDWNNSLEINPQKEIHTQREAHINIESDKSFNDPFLKRLGQRLKRMSAEAGNFTIDHKDESTKYENENDHKRFIKHTKHHSKVVLPGTLDTVVENVNKEYSKRLNRKEKYKGRVL